MEEQRQRNSGMRGALTAVGKAAGTVATSAAAGAATGAMAGMMAVGQTAFGRALAMQRASQEPPSEAQPLRMQASFGGGEDGCGCDGGVIGGGHRGFFGGDEAADASKELREYADSASARAKEDVIRRLARALSNAGIPVDPEGDLNDIVKTLVAKIPNPANGKTFANDAASQEKVCQVIAGVLNDQFTPGAVKAADKLIDTSLGPVSVCRAVGEWAHSFSVGVNTEFLAVHASVRNALSSITALDEVINLAIRDLAQAIDENPDKDLQRQVQVALELARRSQAERTRQEELLKNILNVRLPPAGEMLKIALKSTEDGLATVIKTVGLKPGTSAFSDALAASISSLGSAAAAAEKVHAALKATGLSVNEYLGSSSFADFSRLLDDKVKLAGIPADDALKLIKAMAVLQSTFKNRSNLQDQLMKTGGDDDDVPKSTVDKRVARDKAEKLLLVRDFTGRMSRHYDEILTAVKVLGPELGKKIPISRQTDELRDALVRLRDMRESRIELALTGYYMDAAARERKERFVSSLRYVSTVCGDLMGLEKFREASSFIAHLKDSVDRLVSTIDNFSDIFTKKFGVATGGGEAEYAAVGGADEDDFLPEVTRGTIGLNQVVNEFTYFYYVAMVRTNLEQSSKELVLFGDTYMETLGNAVAARLWNLRRQRKLYEDFMTDANRQAGAIAGVAGALATLAAAFPAGADGDANFAAAKKMVAQEYDTKEKFYKALQAMDLYMKEFTVGIAKDPDAAREIKRMLDDTQVIANWFTEETGEHLWKSFECMGGSDFGEPLIVGRRAGVASNYAPGAVISKIAAAFDTSAYAARMSQDSTHYYQKLVTAMEGRLAVGGVAAAAQPRGFGIPQCSIPAGVIAAPAVGGASRDFAAQAKKHVSSALDYFQALKNLVNAFARIGDQFGGRELSSQVFMSPSQIYKTLMDYMKNSALSLNRGPDPVAGAQPVPVNISVDLPTFVNANGGPDSQRVVAVEPYQVFFGSVQDDVKGNYFVEDRYFTLILKAMAAKILTVLGVYDMFERQTPLYELTPTRFIVGGADDPMPEIIPEAAELYFRIPRLVEFYRGFLRWDGEGGALRVAMLPEVEGIFSGIIKTIFQRMSNPEDGDYSDSELRTIIRETNLIYSHYSEKGKDKVSRNAANGLIMEINRRYGLVKTDEMKKYWKLISRARSGEWANTSSTNYSILPGEDDFAPVSETERRAPSDKFSYPVDTPGVPGAAPRDFNGQVKLDDNIDAPDARRMLIRRFRAGIEKEFALIPRDQFGSVSYAQLVRQAETDIRRAGEKEKAFILASKLIQSTSTIGMETDKAFMFHETVVVGLNALGALHQFIDNYERSISVLNPKTLEGIITDNCLRSLLHGFPAGTIAADTIPGFNLFPAAFPVAIRWNHILAGNEMYAYNVTGAYPMAWLAGRGGFDFDSNIITIYQFFGRELEQATAAAVAEVRVAGVVIPAGGFTLPQLAAVTTMVPPAMPSTITDVSTLTPVQRDFIQGLRFGARYLTDYRLMMISLIENVFTLGGSELIDINIQQGAANPMQISFSKLKTLAESVLADVKMYFDAFRGFVPKDTLARFEDRSSPGSLFWLEEHFFDVRIRGQVDGRAKERTLDGLAQQTNAAFNALTRKIGCGCTGLQLSLIHI